MNIIWFHFYAHAIKCELKINLHAHINLYCYLISKIFLKICHKLSFASNIFIDTLFSDINLFLFIIFFCKNVTKYFVV